jgi:hypothetical protein
MPPPKAVFCWHVRRLFKRGTFFERMQSGELTPVTKDHNPASAKMNQLLGTESQIVIYQNAAGVKVALVHQFVHPDGSLGGHGLPDPKWLLFENVTYVPLLPPEGGIKRVWFLLCEWLCGVWYKIFG